MFQTHKSAEIHIPAEFSDNEFQRWNCIQYILHMYWLQVTYSIANEDGEEQSNIIFLTEIENLIQLKNEDDVIFYDVYLVSPNYMNGDKGWKMETLKEIHSGYESVTEFEQEAYIFVLDNNNRYIHSYMNSSEDELIKRTIIFETENHSV